MGRSEFIRLCAAALRSGTFNPDAAIEAAHKVTSAADAHYGKLSELAELEDSTRDSGMRRTFGVLSEGIDSLIAKAKASIEKGEVDFLFGGGNAPNPFAAQPPPPNSKPATRVSPPTSKGPTRVPGETEEAFRKRAGIG